MVQATRSKLWFRSDQIFQIFLNIVWLTFLTKHSSSSPCKSSFIQRKDRLRKRITESPVMTDGKLENYICSCLMCEKIRKNLSKISQLNCDSFKLFSMFYCLNFYIYIWWGVFVYVSVECGEVICN